MTWTGAHAAVLELQNIRIMKDIRNTVNRQINCENANIDKTVRSAYAQTQDIQTIVQKKGIESLSPALRATADARLSYPEASLSELAELMGVSRSGLYHRFQKLRQIADALRD